MERCSKEEKFWLKQFETQANMPEVWFMTAKELRSSYQVLADHANKTFDMHKNAKTLNEALNNTLPSSLMLAGYSMENYFKGMIIRNSPTETFIKDGKFKLGIHGLKQFAEKINLRISADEKELLEILNYFLMVGGRYPIPLKAIEMVPVKFIDGRIAPIGSHYYNDTQKRYYIYEKVDLFFEKLEKLCPLINE